MTTIREQLDALRELNRWWDEDLGDPHEAGIAPPEPILAAGIPTLRARSYRAPTPMLRELYGYASRWERAFLGCSIPALSDLEQVWDESSKMHRQVFMRRDIWDWSVVGREPLDRLSLLAIDPLDMTEIYLWWPEGDPAEPRVVQYTSGEEKIYADLGELLDRMTRVRRPRDLPPEEREPLMEQAARARASEARRAKRAAKKGATKSAEAPTRRTKK